MTASQKGAFRQAMETHRAIIAAKLAQEAREAGFLWPNVESPDLEAAVDSFIGSWLEAIEEQRFSELEETSVILYSRLQSQGPDAPSVLPMIERAGELLLDTALALLDEGVDGAEEGVQTILRAWNAAACAYEHAFRFAYESTAERTLILRDVAERAPIGIGITSPSGDFTYMNPAHRIMLGFDETDVMGKNIRDILAPEQRQMLPTAQSLGSTTDSREGILRVVRRDGTILRVYTSTFWVFTDQGQPIARCAFVRDMTDEERADEERQVLERQIVEAQEDALRELGTPLLPIAEHVLAMPIVGTIDAARAKRAVEGMLSEIIRTGAGHVIVDITGVPRVTTEVAEMIMQAAKAAELVGAEMVLTGIRGTVAKTLLELGISFAGMETQSTLRAGVAHALEHERAKRRAERPRK